MTQRLERNSPSPKTILVRLTAKQYQFVCECTSNKSEYLRNLVQDEIEKAEIEDIGLLF